ncbi:MAG: hypothetical protein LCH91_24200 [Bacteroidetes bacterium]|nr:hypothetical protein [Bacteroidota bacterium]
MRKILLIGLVALVGLRCKSSSEAMMMPSGCASEKPTLVGKWTMTEFRYYGGCCPVIADSTWKKATDKSYAIEFTNNGKLRVIDYMANGLSSSNAAQLVTNYSFDGKEIAIDEQILGGVPWQKNVTIAQLTTRELIFIVTVGKEGEKNARKFVRICE